MKKLAVRILAGSVVLGLLVPLAFAARFRILAHGMGLFVGAPEFVEAGALGPAVRWFDDYYTIEAIDERTFAIGEPRYWQKNFNFLIVGDARALLFDAGPGNRDIRPVVASLTDLPVTFIPSHLHFDHTGNDIAFEHVGVIDLPYLRARASDGRLTLEFDEHFGAAERIAGPTLEVSEWLRPGSRIDLGSREIVVVHTPGHTKDSVTLIDVAAELAFAGDFLTPGALAAFLPGGGTGDYLRGVESFLQTAPKGARIFGAHPDLFEVGGPPAAGAPELKIDAVEELRTALLGIREGTLGGTGFYPVIYPVNERLELWANPPWLEDRTPRQP